MAGRQGGLPAIAKRVESRWSAVLRLISGWEDAAIVMPIPQRGESLPPGPILPWCDLWEIGGTERSIVCDANDKRTSHTIEVELGMELPGACLIERVDDFERRAGSSPGRWVVKDPWGVAGRERLLGEGSPTSNQANWCRGRLSQGVELIFEPWVEEKREWSLHFDSDGGEVEFVGVCGLLTHGDGTFRGIRPGTAAPAELVDGAMAAAEKIAGLGYHGPIGIDSMIGRVHGEAVVRPVTEINARYSFGRLGLALASRTDVPDFEWRHDSYDGTDEMGSWDELGRGKPCRLPEFCDPDGASGSWCRALEQ